MRSRQEIKEYAKQAFAAQRGSSILAVFLAGLILTAFFVIWMIAYIPIMISESMWGLRTSISHVWMFTSVAVLGIMFLISVPVTIMSLVMQVNINGTMVRAYYGQQITGTEPYKNLKENFGRKLGGMLWMTLWVYIWMMVGYVTFFIPTIIKMLSYSMAPYILASNPHVAATEALNLSKRMTKGHKGKIFMMGLSFWGWTMLDALTSGILGVLYVNPYMSLSYAGLFIELRNYAVATGEIHPAELDGHQAYQQIFYTQPNYPPMHGVQPYTEQMPQQPYIPPPVSPYMQQPPASPHMQQPPASPHMQPPPQQYILPTASPYMQQPSQQYIQQPPASPYIQQQPPEPPNGADSQ